jgi:hypothetical protein
MVEDPVWMGLGILAYGGLYMGTIAGWLLLGQSVQTKMAFVLLVPYLVLEDTRSHRTSDLREFCELCVSRCVCVFLRDLRVLRAFVKDRRVY